MQDEKDRANQQLSVALGIISLFAIIGLLVRTNFETNQVLEAIINLTQVAIPVFVLLMTMKIRKDSKAHISSGRDALVKLQKKYPAFLMGPRYNRDNYDPEKGQGLEYLFIAYDSKLKQRAKLIPIQGLDEGVLAIYVQKNTLSWALGWGEGDKVQDADIKHLQDEVFNVVNHLIERKYKGLYELIPNAKDSAIIIDFEVKQMGLKKFKRAIYECAEEAITTIIKQRKEKI